jgi:putative Mg2+ transporter-C (MgtC) family protein
MLQQLLAQLPPDAAHVVEVAVRLTVAALLGGVIGWNRQTAKQPAGLRTHMLVALGTALFVLTPLEAGGTAREITEAVKGIAAGIGFLGAGPILRGRTGPADSLEEVHGLTTAASIWVTAAVGLAAGAGLFVSAGMTVVLGWIILVPVKRLERHRNQIAGIPE